MSLMNFFDLTNEGYGNFAKGILYVICEIFWKIMHAVGSLIDVVVGLFYKLAGANYLGSGSGSLVEEQDLLGKLFNQNIVSSVSLFMLILSFSLMAIFGVSAVVRKMYFNKENYSSITDVIKNMILAFMFLICLTPLSLFAISAMSTITSSIIGIFGDNSSVSLADLMFNTSFNGDAIAAYNEIYGVGNSDWVDITSWTEMENNFLFDLEYGSYTGDVEFYWYIYLLGGGVVIYNLIVMVFKLIKRIFNVIILYVTAPVYIAKMVDDGGAKFKEWKNKSLYELISVVGTVIAFMILISLVGVINDLELIKVANESVNTNIAGGGVSPTPETVEASGTIALINNLTKVLLIMAGTSVAKDSGELLGNAFKGANEENNLLEGIFNRLGNKETVSSSKGAMPMTPRTRVITRTSTSTRKIINYDEAVPVSRENEKKENTINNNKNTFNTNISNVDRHVTNLQNRANVNVNTTQTQISETGAKSGSYKGNEDGSVNKPTDLLNQEFVNNVRSENNKLRGEWDFVKGKNSESSKAVVKNFESASKDLDSALNSGEPAKIKNSMNRYVEAYRKEEKVAKEGYKDFAGKSTKLSNDLSVKQQQELKKISDAYRKAQVDYSKTARKLSAVSQGNMSTTDALRVKEKADKQREKLMEASSKANNFYNNQKKGV